MLRLELAPNAGFLPRGMMLPQILPLLLLRANAGSSTAEFNDNDACLLTACSEGFSTRREVWLCASFITRNATTAASAKKINYGNVDMSLSKAADVVRRTFSAPPLQDSLTSWEIQLPFHEKHSNHTPSRKLYDRKRTGLLHETLLFSVLQAGIL